jgi:hypothetical protein
MPLDLCSGAWWITDLTQSIARRTLRFQRKPEWVGALVDHSNDNIAAIDNANDAFCSRIEKENTLKLKLHSELLAPSHNVFARTFSNDDEFVDRN